MDATVGIAPISNEAVRRVRHEVEVRPGTIKSWLRMSFPRHLAPGAEADLPHRLGGLDRKHRGETAAVIAFLEQEHLVVPNGNGRHQLTAEGFARCQ